MKKYLLGMIALFAIVVAGSAFSLVTEMETDNCATETFYFRYEESVNDEALFEDGDSWSYEGTQDPGGCGGGDVACIVRLTPTDNMTAGISTSDSDPVKIAKLVNYLSSLNGGGYANAEAFVSQNTEHEKP